MPAREGPSIEVLPEAHRQAADPLRDRAGGVIMTLEPPALERKLAAILDADVEGYSRLMGDDEAATVRTRAAYGELIAELVSRHRGRVIDFTGDNLLAEFASVVDAVAGAVEIQRELAVRNDGLPDHRKMRFRIGINLGDVLVEGDRIFGDGVNVAARVQSLADGGGIAISGTVYDQVESKLALGWESVGEHIVKNIARPVRVYRAVMEPGGAAKRARTGPRSRVVAVLVGLALLVMGGGSGLAVWRAWRPSVPASLELPDKPSIAVLPFANVDGDPRQQHPKLAAAYGWLSTLHTSDAWYGLTPSPGRSLERASELAHQAVALDDSLADGHIALAWVHLVRRQHTEAVAEAERAVALNPGHADATATLAMILDYAGRPEESIELMKNAMRLSPVYPAWYLRTLGLSYALAGRREEALVTLERFRRAAPESSGPYVMLALIYAALDRDAEAQAAMAHAVRLNPALTLDGLAKSQPYKNQADIDRMLRLARRAGLK